MYDKEKKKVFKTVNQNSNMTATNFNKLYRSEAVRKKNVYFLIHCLNFIEFIQKKILI